MITSILCDWRSQLYAYRAQNPTGCPPDIRTGFGFEIVIHGISLVFISLLCDQINATKECVVPTKARVFKLCISGLPNTRGLLRYLQEGKEEEDGRGRGDS